MSEWPPKRIAVLKAGWSMWTAGDARDALAEIERLQARIKELEGTVVAEREACAKAAQGALRPTIVAFLRAVAEQTEERTEFGGWPVEECSHKERLLELAAEVERTCADLDPPAATAVKG